jgi:hemerythrin-like domain-containing protein
MAQAVDARPDTRDMIIIHRVFRREFRLAPQLVARVAAGDRARAQEVARHLAEFTEMLHHHHTLEDELVWPKLRARAELSGELVDRMEAEHAVLGTLLERLGEQLAEWAGTVDEPTRYRVAETLLLTHEALTAHLDGEERDVLPLCRDHLSVAEWAELGARGAASTPKRRRMAILGHILEDATPDERELFLSHVPAPARLAWKVMGRRGHEREVAGLRRGVVPQQRRG